MRPVNRLLVLLLVACHTTALAPTPVSKPAEPSLASTSKTFMVVSEAAAATQVGRDILASGGDAADAAVATAFALAVVHPSAGNLGGGGFAVVRTNTEAQALDFREAAPAAATPDMYLKAGKLASLQGDL